MLKRGPCVKQRNKQTKKITFAREKVQKQNIMLGKLRLAQPGSWRLQLFFLWRGRKGTRLGGSRRSQRDAHRAQQVFFFRPLPSRLSPGRNTVFASWTNCTASCIVPSYAFQVVHVRWRPPGKKEQTNQKRTSKPTQTSTGITGTFIPVRSCNAIWFRMGDQQQAPCRGVPSEEKKRDVRWNLN